MIKNRKKIRLRTQVILIVVLIVLCLCGGLMLTSLSYFNDSNRQIPMGIFEENENSIDGLVIGTSAANRYFVPTEAYANYGAAIEVYATHSIPPEMYRYMIEDALKKQSPEFVAIEIRNFSQNPQTRVTKDVTNLTDHMPADLTRIKTILAIRDFDKKNDSSISSDPRRFRYPESPEAVEQAENYAASLSNYKGYVCDENSFIRKKQSESPSWTEEVGTLSANSQETLNELLDYCETLDCDVIFFVAPCILKSDRQLMLNKVLEEAEERGFETVNFNYDYEMGLIGLEKDDFYNDRHANVYGALKFTDYMYKYLSDKYDFEDHRGDKAYESWDAQSQQLRAIVRERDPDIEFQQGKD